MYQAVVMLVLKGFQGFGQKAMVDGQVIF